MDHKNKREHVPINKKYQHCEIIHKTIQFIILQENFELKKSQ